MEKGSASKIDSYMVDIFRGLKAHGVDNHSTSFSLCRGAGMLLFFLKTNLPPKDVSSIGGKFYTRWEIGRVTHISLCFEIYFNRAFIMKGLSE
jgi:hypothetical protein